MLGPYSQHLPTYGRVEIGLGQHPPAHADAWPGQITILEASYEQDADGWPPLELAVGAALPSAARAASRRHTHSELLARAEASRWAAAPEPVDVNPASRPNRQRTVTVLEEVESCAPGRRRSPSTATGAAGPGHAPQEPQRAGFADPAAQPPARRTSTREGHQASVTYAGGGAAPHGAATHDVSVTILRDVYSDDGAAGEPGSVFRGSIYAAGPPSADPHPPPPHPGPHDAVRDGAGSGSGPRGAAQDGAPPPTPARPAAEQVAADERAAGERAADERAANERAADERAANQRAADERAAHERAANQRAADERAADERAANQRAADERAAHERAAHERTANQRAADERAADERAANQRAADERAAHERAAAECAAAERAADARWGRISEGSDWSGTASGVYEYTMVDSGLHSRRRTRSASERGDAPEETNLPADAAEAGASGAQLQARHEPFRVRRAQLPRRHARPLAACDAQGLLLLGQGMGCSGCGAVQRRWDAQRPYALR